ncbi:monovalent cation:proton antiporter-2 (CPA2) family protein [Leptospira bandrabouensis]|uniref:monovalent cation:proton antiporter-2 (CPA2) family protein n=1 Tax=Leptospira bandrabouensis TaxID=2484903 RepID=UPI001EE911E6|nr:monovalent cation:proton antiporter-2 (CPA2) family protein [Leptospira bandrabouensis]MCG6145058.1 monovalent cation:proton antiporter-2 (CPA2) family protein [Leptospira bandrabouensis]MCG6160305.1 monovalent cation:proton antiporter-2 (CPA2) family protein [Leptospira bandrabouensis]MCG6164237.1 monovalent cation:proton antiporter-2 (CPA2) family protein [Leptospira bandrabouensis]
MNELGFFVQALIYLTSAIIIVPIANRLGLGSVLGYLIAGIVIGPFVFGFVGTEGKDMLHFAEFGVVMMLFAIGLELELDLLWRLKFWLLGLGGLQIILTTAITAGFAFGFGFHWKPSLALGLILSLSSTAIVLQTLKEKGLMKSVSGQAAFSVLLFQDMAVIPILAIFPMLSDTDVTTSAQGHSLIEHLPGYAKTLVVLSVVIGIILVGKYLLSPFFRLLAKSGNREIFTGASLLLVIAISVLMGAVGVSAALGTFLGGVVLASSEYRHELESNIEPFKGLLLGLFFLSVGASMDLPVVIHSPSKILGIVFGIIFIKALVLFFLGFIFRIPLDQNLYFSLALSQVGEFSFVLFGYSEGLGLFKEESIIILVACVAVSMAITPVLLLLYEKTFFGLLESKISKTQSNQNIHKQENPVIICGFGRFGNMLGRFLRSNGIPITILDFDADRVEMLGRFGFKVYFGDPTRLELLESAGLEHVKVLVAALDNSEKQTELIRNVSQHYPQIKIVARAGDREDAYNLKEMGVTYIYRETRETAVQMGKDVLKLLGTRAHTAEKAKNLFLKHDDDTFHELFALRADRVQYMSLAKQRNAELERLMFVDLGKEEELGRDPWSEMER